MAARNFFRNNFRVSRQLQLALLVSNATVLLINLFVGLLVYQNPLIALTDMQNVFFVILFGTGIPVAIYVGYRLSLGIRKIYRVHL